MKTRVAMLALLAGTSVAAAAPIGTASGPAAIEVWGVTGDANNTAFTVALPAGNAQALRFGGSITGNVDFTWADDVEVEVTAPSGATFIVQLLPVTGNILGVTLNNGFYARIPAASAGAQAAGNWTFRLVDAVEDGDGTTSESTVNGLTITLDDGVVTAPAATALGAVANGATRTDSLGVGELRWYSLTLPATTGTGFVELSTNGSVNADTVMSLYDATTGAALDFDDDGGLDALAQLSWGAGSGLAGAGENINGGNGPLAAGNYFLAVGEFFTFFGLADFNAFSCLPGAGGDVTLTARIGNRTLTTPLAEDLGSLISDRSVTATVDPAGIKWYRFVIPAAVDATANRFLDITTDATTAVADTELGLYRADGTLRVADDDGGVGLLSLMSFGLGSGTAGGIGQSGTLDAGTYFLAVVEFNTLFNGTFFGVVPPADGVGGDIAVDFRAGTRVISAPPAEALGNVSTRQVTATIPPDAIKWYTFNVVNAIPGTGPNFNFLDIHTNNSAALASADTELGVFSNTGSLVATNDDGGIGFLSLLSFGIGSGEPLGDAGAIAGGVNGSLPTGTYFLSVSEFNTGFGANGFAATPPVGEAGGDATVDFLVGQRTAPAAPAATAFATLGNGSQTRTEALDANEVTWFSITLPGDASVASTRFVDINTVGSDIDSTFGADDTQIALFRALGTVVAGSDDSGGTNLSALSFGATSPARPAGPGTFIPAGQNGTLTAGTYYLAASGWPLTTAGGFVATTTNPNTGNITVNVNSNFLGCGPADVGSQGGAVGADGLLNNNDFSVFVTLFFQQAQAADVGAQGGVVGSDGAWDNNDFGAFVTLFFQGLPNCQ